MKDFFQVVFAVIGVAAIGGMLNIPYFFVIILTFVVVWAQS